MLVILVNYKEFAGRLQSLHQLMKSTKPLWKLRQVLGCNLLLLMMMPLLLMADRSLAGSLIGGIPATQEMLEFCAEHKIGADIELISIEDVNEAWERIERNDVKYRFVIDLTSLR